MKRLFLLVLISVFALDAAFADDGFNTLSVGAGYQYFNIFGDSPVSFHGPGPSLSNMNSIDDSGLFVYEDVLVGFPLSLSYGSEVRERDMFVSITSLDASLGAGWAGREGIIRYFFGGGLQLGMLALEVRCGSLLDLDIGVNAMAGMHVVFNDLFFLECSVKAVYSFLDIQHVAMSSGNDWTASLINGLGISGRIAIGVDLS